MSRSNIRLLKVDHVFDLTYPRDVEFMTFPGGEEHVKGNLSEIPGATFIIDARLSDAAGILRVLLLTDWLRSKVRRPRIHLFCPYLPGARQDRGSPLSAKVYADLINSADFESVTSVDPHSDVMPALIRNEYHIPLEDVFPLGPFSGPTRAVLVIPDAGAGKRVSALANKYGYQTVQALKHRDPKTGQLSRFTCEEVPPEFDHAIIVDDICDGGGTFLGLAPKITWQTGNQPKLGLWTTHGIYSKGLGQLADVFTTIASTDSFPAQDHEEILPGSQALTRVELSATLQRLVNNKEFM